LFTFFKVCSSIVNSCNVHVLYKITFSNNFDLFLTTNHFLHYDFAKALCPARLEVCLGHSTTTLPSSASQGVLNKDPTVWL
jgi:hypothetical protein